jgi:glycosyltransferase involved in cell wall biosynthesis
MKHKVLIDTIALLSPLTGIGRYTYEVSKEILKFEEFELNYFYGYYSKELFQIQEKSKLKKLKSIIKKVPYLKRFMRKIISLRSQAFTPSFDLYWQPNFIPNTKIKTKKLITSVHDFSFILHRDYHPKERIEYFDKYFFKSIVASDMIITGSHYSKNEILERLDFSENQIRVIYHGVNHNLFKIYDNLEIDFKLPTRFILSVGSIEPRKNLLGLLKAYNSLNLEIKKEYKLVLIGFKGWQNSEIMELINNNKENIDYLGFVSDKELAKVYNLASLFVFPSFYEGFGLPPLEAMACATPVVTSNLTSMPEICLDAAIYCNPNDEQDIKNKVELVLLDKELQKNLIEKGLKRAKEFTWEKSANEHMKVFQEVLKT